MIGSLIAMFICGAVFALCICVILFLRYVDRGLPSDSDMEQMCLWYEGEYDDQ